MKYCSYCANKLRDTAKFCNLCWKAVIDDPTNFKFCDNCGTKIDKNAKYCYSCGSNQEEGVFNDEVEEKLNENLTQEEICSESADEKSADQASKPAEKQEENPSEERANVETISEENKASSESKSASGFSASPVIPVIVPVAENDKEISEPKNDLEQTASQPEQEDNPQKVIFLICFLQRLQ